MSDYTEYFLNSESNVVQLELIEISHSNFSQTYRKVRNATNGITVTLENASVETFDYYPLKISFLGERNDLDQGLKIDLGDLGEILPIELDNVMSNNGFGEKPVLKYRAYRSDNLTQPLFGPWTLEISQFSFKNGVASFEARAPLLNINRTGKLYTIKDFPMLRGFL